MADIIQVICWSLLALVLLPINIVCLLVLWRTKQVNKVTKLCLICLTCTDIEFCIIYVIPAIGIAMWDNQWPYSNAWCVFQALVIQPHFCIVVLSLLFVNVDRFIAISFPLKYPQIMTVKRTVAVMTIMTKFQAILGICYPIALNWKAIYNPLRQYCTFESIYVYIHLLLVQDIVITLTFGIYARIVCIIRRQQRRRLGMQQNNSNQVSNRKAAKTIFFITLSLFVCLVPLQTVIFLEFFGVKSPIQVAIFTNLCFSSSGIWNAVIYYMGNKTIRKETKELFSTFFYKTLTGTSSTISSIPSTR